MSQDHGETEKKSYPVGGYGGDDVGEVEEEEDEDDSESLYSLLCITIGSILFPDPKTGDASSFSSLLQRMRNSVAENGPKLLEASRKTSRDILRWTRQGSPLRALLVITMGTIGLLTTIALVVFTLFFVAATANAIIISLLVSLAVAGGFLSLFFLSLTATYIGALSVAAFVISTATVSAVVSILFASGWIGFFYVVWLGARGSLRLAKQSVMGLAISGNSCGLHQDKDREVVSTELSSWIGFLYVVWLGARGSLRLAKQSVMGLAISGNSCGLHQDKDREVVSTESSKAEKNHVGQCLRLHSDPGSVHAYICVSCT